MTILKQFMLIFILIFQLSNLSPEAYGRLYIPSVDINVQLYETVNGDHKAQDYVDAQDSAAYRISHKGGCGFIADHYNQGFIKIKKCKVGCYCYIISKNDIEIYKCMKVISGRNDGNNLYTADGERLSDIDYADFACYTCDGNWQNVYMVFFKRI